MEVVTVSPKFQVVIPKNACKTLDIHAGQKIQVFVYDGRIELIPLTSVQKLRRLAKGIDTTIERENDRI